MMRQPPPRLLLQQQQCRWMGASNGHNRKKRIEKNELNPNDQTMEPEFNETRTKELEIIEKRFERLNKERPGRHRGIECARQMVLEEKIERKASTACGNLYLNTWLYRRFTLALGYKKITHVPGIVLANTLIRDGTTIRFDFYRDPKRIILELYRYPTVRPTVTQQKYMKMDKEASMTPDEAKRILNFDHQDEDEEFGDGGHNFQTPGEEFVEKKLLERTIFAANSYRKNSGSHHRRTNIRSKTGTSTGTATSRNR